MGYDLHIIRKNNWEDFEEESNITLDEWLKYITTDSELELTDGYDIKIGEEQYFQNRPGYCEWNAHPKYKAQITDLGLLIGKAISIQKTQIMKLSIKCFQ